MADGGQVFQVAGIAQDIQVDDRFFVPGQPFKDEVAADEAGAASYEQCHGCYSESAGP